MVIAPYVRRPLQIDGRLNEPIWREAPRYELVLPASLSREGRTLQEPGHVRFAWNSDFLYVGLDLQDSDLVAEGSSNGQMHNKMGDTCELMIKPERQTWYWEFHVTPAGLTSAFFFPGRGRLCVPSCLQHDSAIQAAAHCDGTLNQWLDRDRGWTAEIAVPLSELTIHGERFEPGARWSVLIGRYNYSRYLATRGPELTAMPLISKADFHCHEEYARLELAD